MRKLFSLFAAILFAGSMMADAVTIGLTQPVDDNAKTMAAAVYTGAANLTVAEAHGEGCGINQGAKVTQYAGEIGSGKGYNAEKTFRKTVNSATWDATEWIGFTVTVATGKKVSFTNLKGMLCDASSNATYTWRLIIENASGTALYTLDKAVITKGYNWNDTIIATPTGVSDLAAGQYTIKLQVYQNGSNKYFTIPYLTVDAEVAEDQSTTYDVTTSVNPANAGTISGGGTWTEGANVVLTATPATGYKFVNWTIDEATETANPYTISAIAADHNVVANFEALPKVTYSIGIGNGNVPDADYVESGSQVTLPSAQTQLMYKEGYTMTGWSDGINTYANGAKVTITENKTFTAQFTANTVALGIEETTVDWTFKTSAGAPAAAVEGKIAYYAKKVLINSTALDVIMKVNTETGAAFPETRGKWNTTSADNRAQVNKGTIFTIPAIAGMVVTVTITNGTAAADMFTFDGEQGEADAQAKTVSYTYEGTAATIDIIDQGKNTYPAGISVVYPVTAPITYTRTIPAGEYGTICLPYNAIAEGAVIMSMNGRTADASGIVFEYVGATEEESTALVAGRPYIFRATADEQTFVLTPGTKVNAPVAENYFVGTFEAINALTEGLYFLNDDNKFHPAGENVKIGANRCYINTDNIAILDEAQVDAEAASRVVVFGTKNPIVTGVEEATAAKATKALVNGKMVIMRGARTYNINGAKLK